MSQQKVIFALALVAGCVALASCQNIDVNQCTQAGQKLVSDYAEQMQSNLSKMTASLAQQGSSTYDINKIQEQISQIMKQLTSLANANSFNFEQTMNTWMQVVRMQSSLAMSMFNPTMGVQMGRTYLEFLTNMMTMNSNFALSMTTACVPSLRSTNSSY